MAFAFSSEAVGAAVNPPQSSLNVPNPLSEVGTVVENNIIESHSKEGGIIFIDGVQLLRCSKDDL
ncbi:MAG: hypothetical protein AAF827_01540 [Cyanobacteria bacterium P01_D01_bin.6]